MLSSLPPYLVYIIAIVASAVISMYAVRKTIFITGRMKIYDVPDRIRKIHGAGIPSLGGIGIFAGYIIVAALTWPMYQHYLPFLLCSTVMLFFTGFYDDLVNMRPSKKLAAQLLASFITIYFADLRMDAFFNVLGIEVVPYWLSISVTTLACTFFINVFNFIDGIDGLACALGILYMALFGSLFALAGYEETAVICFALVGATAGLLVYNMAPAKIYMGDTGSMFLGFSIFIFSLLFIGMYSDHKITNATPLIHGVLQAVVFSIAMLFIPVYDGLRVFILRASKGISPLKADRRHLHYYLLDAGCTHSQAVGIIVVMNLLVIALAYLMQDMNIYLTLGGCIVLVSAIVMGIYRWREWKMK